MKRFSGALVDLDGTVFFKSKAIVGAREALEGLRSAGVQLRFLSNTDSITPARLAASVTELGVPIGEGETYTAASAALEFLKRSRNEKCLCLLSGELKAAFAEFLSNEEGEADFVVVGDCREGLSYGVLNNAFRAIKGGAKLIALQKGRYFVREDGANLDTGAFVAMLEYAAGVTAQVLGKPSPEFFLGAVAQMGLGKHEVVVIGDDVETDIRGANNAGLASILVRTGKYSRDTRSPSDVAPTWVVDSLADVPAILLEHTD